MHGSEYSSDETLKEHSVLFWAGAKSLARLQLLLPGCDNPRPIAYTIALGLCAGSSRPKLQTVPLSSNIPIRRT